MSLFFCSKILRWLGGSVCMSKLVPYYVVRGLIATSWSALLAHRPWDLAIFHQGVLKLSRR
jgi:hypothetical protein